MYKRQSQKKGRDYTVGTSVIWGEEEQLDPEGKRTGNKQTVAYVRKIVRDRMLPHQIVQNVVKLAQEEHPFAIAIENAQGATYLKDSLLSAALRTGDKYIIDLVQGIDWFTPDQQKDAKKLRMGGLHPWISEGRFKFANYCMEGNTPPGDKIEVVYNEFIGCMFQHHRDDIPDNLGYQASRFSPPATMALVENNREIFSCIEQQGWNELYNEDYQQQGSAYYLDDDGNMVPLYSEPQSGLMDMFVPEPEVEASTPNGLDNILGIGIFG